MKNTIVKDFKVPILLGVITMILQILIMSILNTKMAILISFLIPNILSILLLVIYKRFDMCGWFTLFNCGVMLLFMLIIFLAGPMASLNYEAVYSLMLNWLGSVLPCFLVQLIDKKNRFSNFKPFFRLVSIIFAFIYIFVLAYAFFFKYTSYSLRGINIIPFKTIIAYLAGTLASSRISFLNLLANLVLFIPLGFYLAIINIKNKTIYKIIVLFALPFIIEILQFIMKSGISDIDDIILNFFGGLLGMALYFILEKIYTLIQQNNDVKMLEL